MATSTIKNITPTDIGALAVDGSNAMHDWVKIDASSLANGAGIDIAMSNDRHWFLYPTGTGDSFNIAGNNGMNWFWVLSADMATGKVSLNQPLGITSGGTEANNYKDARKNLKIGEKIIDASMAIYSQASNSWNVFSTDGSTAWKSPTLETGLYLFSVWLREQGGGPCNVALKINSSGEGDPIMNEEVADWGIIYRTFIVEITSSYVYLWHKHEGTAHTADAKVSIYRLN